MMDSFVFLNPIYGILAFILGILILFFVYKTKNKKLEFKFIDDIEKIFGKGSSFFKGYLVFLFLLISLFSLIIANPNLKGQKEEIKKDGIDIVLVLDLSYSMLAQDIQPNRLEVSKSVISDFVSQLKTDRIGLVVFSGKPFTSIPLTFDYKFVNNFINKITIDTINQDYQYLQGTAIGDGVLYGANLFDKSDREKVLVLLTDGEANRGIEPIQAVRYIKDKNIKIHTVGIGGYKDTYVNIRNAFADQKIGVGGVDEKTLKSIANLTGGEYYRASDNNTFSLLFQKLNLLQKKEIKVDEVLIYKPFYKPFVYAIILVFLMFLSFNYYYYLKN